MQISTRGCLWDSTPSMCRGHFTKRQVSLTILWNRPRARGFRSPCQRHRKRELQTIWIADAHRGYRKRFVMTIHGPKCRWSGSSCERQHIRRTRHWEITHEANLAETWRLATAFCVCVKIALPSPINDLDICSHWSGRFAPCTDHRVKVTLPRAIILLMPTRETFRQTRDLDGCSGGGSKLPIVASRCSIRGRSQRDLVLVIESIRPVSGLWVEDHIKKLRVNLNTVNRAFISRLVATVTSMAADNLHVGFQPTGLVLEGSTGLKGAKSRLIANALVFPLGRMHSRSIRDGLTKRR